MFDRADIVVFMVNDLSHIPEYACSSSKTRIWSIDDFHPPFPYTELCMGRDAILTRIVELVNELEVTKLMRR
jgi:hypothetical protein